MTVGIYEARAKLSELVRRAAQGEEVVITERGVPKVRLEPEEAPLSPEELAEAIATFGQRHGLRATFDEVKSWVEEGRA